MLLQLSKKHRRKNSDADNRVKAVLDFCTRVGLIEDDKLLEVGTFMWSHHDVIPEGCRVTLWRIG
jgi:Holliday junction resolvase RusA-like endonuclease